MSQPCPTSTFVSLSTFKRKLLSASASELYKIVCAPVIIKNSLPLVPQDSFMNIRIANISLNTTDSELRKLFVTYGNVDSATVCRNALNGRSLKYGQVDMPVSAQGRQAIASLDKTLLDGKIISVSELPSEPY